MSTTDLLLPFGLGLALGAALAAAWLRGRAAEARAAADARAAETLQAEKERRAALEATLDSERRSAAEKAALLEDAQARLTDTFKALSADALQAQGRQFLELAKGSLEKLQTGAQGDLAQRQTAIAALVGPVKETVDKLQLQLAQLESKREGAYAALREQVGKLDETQGALRQEAGRLVQALRAPQVRGRWGEVQLRRVVELAGMEEHCDFEEQHTVEGSGGRLRPDLLVRMSNGRVVAVDAKAPLDAWLKALEAPDEAARRARLADHARQVRDHVQKLAGKQYQEHVGITPEFVVLFLPNEAVLYGALEQDPQLAEKAIEAGVLLATPMTLVGLLKAVALGWREEAIAENSRRISELGGELYERLAKLGDHVERLGRSLSGSVKAYNDFVGSLESRVLVSGRKFRELGAGPASAQIAELRAVEELPRPALSPELASAPEALAGRR